MQASLRLETRCNALCGKAALHWSGSVFAMRSAARLNTVGGIIKVKLAADIELELKCYFWQICLEIKNKRPLLQSLKKERNRPNLSGRKDFESHDRKQSSSCGQMAQLGSVACGVICGAASNNVQFFVLFGVHLFTLIQMKSSTFSLILFKCFWQAYI